MKNYDMSGYAMGTKCSAFLIFLNSCVSGYVILKTKHSCLTWKWYIYLVVINLWCNLIGGLVRSCFFLCVWAKEYWSVEGFRSNVIFYKKEFLDFIEIIKNHKFTLFVIIKKKKWKITKNNFCFLKNYF